MSRLFFTAILTLAIAAGMAQTLPYQNLQLSAAQRADDLLGRLTLEEKVSLMMDTSPAIPRLGIPQFQWWNEALHGVGRNGFATVFRLKSEKLATALPFTKVRDAGSLRTIKKGKAKVAEAPSEQDWNHAAVYRIQLSVTEADSSLLRIHYRGDCARLYANGKLVADNFYYGRPFLYGLWRLPKDCTELELRILPLQPDAPIYLPREADRTAGEAITKIEIINRN